MENTSKTYWNFRIFAAFFLGILFTLGIGRWTGKEVPEPIHAVDVSVTDEAEEASHSHTTIRYGCPMMCVPPMESAGDCPICGMALKALPVEETPADGVPRLTLSPEAVRLARIQTAPAVREAVSAEIRVFGQIDYDPAHTTRITAFMPGVIDRVYVKRAGQFVRWGDPLFDIYSADLLETQKQLIEAMRYAPSFLAFQAGTPHVARDMPVLERERSKGAGESRSEEEATAIETIAAIRHKLSILGLPKRDIDQLMKVGEATGIATVYASMYGQISEQNAFEGTYVNTGTPIFTIADPRYVWLKLDAYETDYPWIRKGQKVTFQVDAYPGETFSAKVVYIDPVFNTDTRTFPIGAISTDDRGGRLKAGMLTRAVLYAGLTAEGQVTGNTSPEVRAPLVIPATAPLITGKRAVVYVADPEETGRFEGREIILGPRAGDRYIVTGGLAEGERVVTNGNFKIDSAVQILAKGGMMQMQDGHAATGHHNPGNSGQMHAEYAAERMASRMRMLDDSGDGTPTREIDSRGGSHQGHRDSSTVRRRRPGMYGDSTRMAPRTPYRQ